MAEIYKSKNIKSGFRIFSIFLIEISYNIRSRKMSQFSKDINPLGTINLFCGTLFYDLLYSLVHNTVLANMQYNFSATVYQIGSREQKSMKAMTRKYHKDVL